MDAKELRIGNYVKIDDLPIEQITLETFATLKEYPNTISLFNPIPLTEEWLRKLGFNHTFLNGPIRINSWCKRIPCKWGNELIIEAKVECIDNGIEAYLIATHARAIRVERKYQYVHQVQNLYFALTQEELTIKE